MNDITELKQFVIAHAKAQGIPEARYRGILGKVSTDDEGAADSWAHEWSAVGRELEQAGDHLEAARCFNMARFPYVDGPARQDALDACVKAFTRWADTKPGIERLDVDVPGGHVSAWASGLSATAPRPLVIITGGIISIKEQWAPILPMADRLGMAIVVAEMPRVGENTLPYTADSWRMYPALLDAIGDRADTGRTYPAALSFSGHLALRWAAADPRVRGLLTIGAPVNTFFTDQQWFGQLPRVTVDTLAHLTGTPAGELPALFREDWPLGASLLESLDVPLYYTASRRDEIIPQADITLLRQHVRQLELTEYDDVHGSPSHTDEIRLWVPNSLLRMSGTRAPQRVVTGLLLSLLRLRGRMLTRT